MVQQRARAPQPVRPSAPSCASGDGALLATSALLSLLLLVLGARAAGGGGAGAWWQTLSFAATAATDASPPPAIDCAAVFARHEASAPASEWPPQCPLPAASPLRAAYERGNMRIARDFCFAQRYEGAGERMLDWSEAAVEEQCAALASGASLGSYNRKELEQMRDALARWAVPAGGAGMVMGSETPWVECLALAAGAARVTTWEYSRILTDHPRLHAAPTKELARGFASGALPPVDWVVSFSSLEHSGLGRYGDAPNPDGDRDAVEEAWCALRPGGVLALGVPMSCADAGYIEFNAHRVYGYERLAYIARGFEVVAFQGVGCEDYLEVKYICLGGMHG